MNFYTNVLQRGNYLYVRGVSNSRRYTGKIEYHPTVWINGKLGSSEEWKTLYDDSVYSFKPGTMRETTEYIAENKDIHGRTVYSAPGFGYQYIAEEYPGNISWDRKKSLHM